MVNVFYQSFWCHWISNYYILRIINNNVIQWTFDLENFIFICFQIILDSNSTHSSALFEPHGNDKIFAQSGTLT